MNSIEIENSAADGKDSPVTQLAHSPISKTRDCTNDSTESAQICNKQSSTCGVSNKNGTNRWTGRLHEHITFPATPTLGICRYFPNCRYGNGCRYAHDVRRLASIPMHQMIGAKAVEQRVVARSSQRDISPCPDPLDFRLAEELMQPTMKGG